MKVKINKNTGIWESKIAPSTTLIRNDDGSQHWGSNSEHKVDKGLAKALCLFLEEPEIKNIVDFGCGNADYAKILIGKGKNVDAFDGNPYTPEMTGGVGKVLDLSKKFNLNKKYDCIISLEVGEHIPPEYEQIYIDNLDRHANRCIILSWALPNQGGDGHVNERPNDYIKKEFIKRGYTSWDDAEIFFRSTLTDLWWFQKTIMVFIKGIN